MAFVSNEEIDSIRVKADIVDIARSYGEVVQRGKNYFCSCPSPEHSDSSPSTCLYPDSQTFYCFGCKCSGNVFNFVMEIEGVSFNEAVSIVASKCGLTYHGDITNEVSNKNKEYYEIMELSNKFYQNNLKTSFGKEALNYLYDRGITDDIIKDFGIGLSLDSRDSLNQLLKKKDYDIKKVVELGLVDKVGEYDFFTRRITFPLWDKDGNIVGFSGRIYRGEKDVSKYMNSGDTIVFKKGETLYNYHNAKQVAKSEKTLIVVEGFMDAIRLATCGIKNVVALQGTAMTHEQILLLKKLRVKIILCLDNDSAGLLATLKNGEELVNNEVEVKVIRLSGEKDPDEYILKNGVDAFKQNLVNPISFLDFKINYLKKDKDLTNEKDKSQYIRDVLDNIKNESDEILKEVVLTSLSKECGIGIDFLHKQLLNMSESLEPIKKVKEEVKKPINDRYYELCNKVLYFMMNDKKYVLEYQKSLGYLDNQDQRVIANEILYYLENHGNINIADFVTYVNIKSDFKEMVMNIINESMNDEVNLDIFNDYLKAINKLTVKKEINKIKEQMKNELDVDKKMKLAMQIAELKKGCVDNG